MQENFVAPQIHSKDRENHLALGASTTQNNGFLEEVKRETKRIESKVKGQRGVTSNVKVDEKIFLWISHIGFSIKKDEILETCGFVLAYEGIHCHGSRSKSFILEQNYY